MCAERQTIRTKNLEQLRSPRAHHDAEQSTGRGEKNSFRDDLLNDMLAAGAHRLADGHLFRPAARTNQEKVDQINRADEQEEKYAALHQQECRTDGADVLGMQRPNE